MVRLRVFHGQVEFRPRNASGRSGIGQGLSQKISDAPLGHQAERPAAGQLELGHPGHMERGFASENLPIEFSTEILVAHI